jgi:hypothetical protein
MKIAREIGLKVLPLLAKIQISEVGARREDVPMLGSFWRWFFDFFTILGPAGPVEDADRA